MRTDKWVNYVYGSESFYTAGSSSRKSPEARYRTHNSPPPAPILRQDQLSPCPHSTSWRFVLILSPYRPRFLKRYLYLSFPHQNPCGEGMHLSCAWRWER